MKNILVLIFFILLNYFLFGQIPDGYYSTLEGKSGAALKTALHDIICQDTTHYLTYGSGNNHTWEGFYSTDRENITNLVMDMYSDSLRYFPTNYIALGYPGFGMTIQIEHSVPKSWWNCDINHLDCAAEDLNHLFPSDGITNNFKSAHPLGIVSGTISYSNGVSKIGLGNNYGYVGKVFEPSDIYKGDFARSYFYIATAYEHYVNKWDITNTENMMEANIYPTLKPWAIQLLLQWHRQDLVSLKEKTRVGKVFDIQRNRNPFIDYPELIEYIWGNKFGTAWHFTVTDIQKPIKPKLKIYPNPSKGSVYIESESSQGKISYKVITLAGSMVLSGSTEGKSINISTLHSGIYQCSIESQTEKMVSKLVVL
jgi:endonuclease I